MKINSKKQNDDFAVDMSPMIDLVFLLLIFFLVASSIIKVDKVEVAVPEAVFAKLPEDTTGRFEIAVTSGGKLYVSQIEVSLDELQNQLQSELEGSPKLRVFIRADRQVKYNETKKVMAACAEVGANDLIYAAFEK